MRPCRGLRHGVLVGVFLLMASRGQAQSGDGFLFAAPRGSVSVRGGFDRAIAGSDLFSFTTKQLTIDRGDFSSPTIHIDVDYTISPKLDARFSFGFARANHNSEFRDYVDNNRLPIEQRTEFTRLPLTASVKAYLSGPGRSVGHFAWIPSRYAPYVGAGGGALWYRFQQQGDFIDFETTKVFPDLFDSEGWTPTVQAFAGTDVSLNPRFAVTMEGRYQWARTPLSVDFRQFAPIDLSGFSLTAGFAIRY
jgi:hypothetical protein